MSVEKLSRKILKGNELLLDLGFKSRQELKDEFGCVIRSIESVSGCLATEEAWDERFDQMQEKIESLLKIPKASYAWRIWHEKEAFVELTEKLRKNDTPLGNFLKGFEATYKVFAYKELVQSLRSNEKVVVFFYTRMKNRDRLHAAHVGLRGRNELFSLSDPSLAKIFKKDFFAAVVFTSKNQHEI